MENVHLVLMGYGDEKLLDELDQIAEDLDVKERYSKFGSVPSELVPSIYVISGYWGGANSKFLSKLLPVFSK